MDLYKLLYPNEQGKKVDELTKLYKYPVIKDIYSDFKNKDSKLIVITSIESNFYRMKNIVKKIQKTI